MKMETGIIRIQDVPFFDGKETPVPSETITAVDLKMREPEGRRYRHETRVQVEQARIKRLIEKALERLKTGRLTVNVGDSRPKMREGLRVQCPRCGVFVDLASRLNAWNELNENTED